jgi:hypothetical protein
MKSIAGFSWGSHPDNILIWFKGLVRSVLEYGCVCVCFSKILRSSVSWPESQFGINAIDSHGCG